MVKTPRTRHAKPRRTPITIELEANQAPPAEGSDEPSGGPEAPAVKEPAEPARDEPYAAESAPAADVPLEEPVEERIETEAARTGSERVASDYAFDPREREAAAPSSPETPAPARPFLSGLPAGLIGAAAAIAAVMALQWAGVLTTPGSGQPGPSIEPVQAEVATLRSELEALKSAPAPDTGGLAASVEQLKSQLAALESSVQSGGGGDDAAVAALDAKVREIEGKVTAASPDVAEKLSGLESQVAAATEAMTRSDGRLTALEQSVSGLAGRVDQQAAQPKVALAIATAALKSAVDRGGPFGAELETLAAMVPEAPELAALRQHAENGIATEADLTAAMTGAADAMIAAAAPVDENAGVVQRLFDSAKSMVKVRPVGDVAGEDVGARVARMEVAVKAGQYDRAIAEYDALPEASKAAGAAFAERVRARLEVTRLVDQLVAAAMKAA